MGIPVKSASTLYRPITGFNESIGTTVAEIGLQVESDGTVLILRWRDLKGSGGIERAVLRKIEDFSRKGGRSLAGCSSKEV